MSRRRRLIIIIVLLVIGIPLIAVAALAGYIWSRGLQNELSAGWVGYGMPGQLRIERIRFTALDSAVAEGISLGEAGKPAIATAERAIIRFDALDRRLLALRIEGVRGELDQDRYRILDEILKAEAKHPPTRAPRAVVVDVAGSLRMPGGSEVEDAVVHVEALGAAATVSATGRIAGRPLELAIATSRVRPDAPVVTTVEVKAGAVDVRHAIDAVVGLGLVEAPPPEALPFLPGVVDLIGSTVAYDPVADSFTGQVKAAWEGGSANANLDADRRRLVIDRLVLRDARLGSASGRVEILRRGRGVAVDADAWQAGPGLPLPAQLPLGEVAALMPGLQIRWPVEGQRTAIVLVGASQARLEFQLGGGMPPRVLARELPLALVRSLIPPPLLIGGGNAASLTATLVDGRPEVSVEVRQARFLAEGWAFGPLDGHIAAVLAPDGGVQVSADLPIGDQPGLPTRITFAGTAREGVLGITCQAIEGLLARLRPPGLVRLPDLSGRFALQAAFHAGPEATTVEVQRLELGGAELRLNGRDFVRSLDAALKGRATVSTAAVTVDLGGQLRSGQILIPGTWLDVAARTPIFSLDLAAALRDGRLQSLELRKAMVRAANAKGEPLPGGFSAQFDGRLEGERLSGRVNGVIDHGDLGWIVGKVAPGNIQVGGEYAITAVATIEGGEAQRIDGAFLPLGADLDIARGKLRVGGITGNVLFTIGGKGGK